ncbi:Acyl-CoA thioesterase 1 [Pseudidiomarina piscicola]|uniref:Acyl-CoA thioesterase 1 n=1 Tax=Pseudidiomarina piscicola TaxID=2614830 RepID=A0A7D9N2L1_9GAMM|nr:arylesterase [Pseudidiomarina piscicola]CAB0149746.1 Acyl-CoA thioesterase 1 [Pseudidiomarina piscicola]VZT39194.1 Acyl-CoA thioesterase 1 [Pseudomonas aeruginosa]
MKNFLIKFGFIVALLVLVRPVYGNVSLVVLGDSLSAGYGMSQQQSWVGVLQQRWQQTQPSIELINASISGDTTQGALNRLEGILKTHQPDAVLVELGGNDGLRGFTPTTIKANLRQIIERLQADDIKVAVSQIRIPPNYGQRYSQMFADIFPELTSATNTVLVPFFMEEIAMKPELMQNDGIHPNREAQDDIADIMEPHLLELLDQ